MKRKNVLFISRNFFEYDQRIKLALEANGYNIVQYSIFPKHSIIDKVCKRILKNKFIDLKAKKQQRKMLREICKSGMKYDIVFLLAGQTMRRDTVEVLRMMNPSSKFIWYIWDNIKRLREFNKIRELFDVIISFDKIDAQQYGIEFLPLFYFKEIKNKKEYDIGFIGTDHSDRRRILSKILEKKFFPNPFFYIYTSKNMEKMYKIVHAHTNLNKYLKTEPLTIDNSADICSKCNVVIDLPFPHQTGLSMRIFEAVGGHSKILTTNPCIKMYDIYDENNVFVIDREEMLLPTEDFFNLPYKELNREIIKKYCFSNWVNRLICYFEDYAI